MLIFDIDKTLVRSHYPDHDSSGGEVRRVFGFELFMDEYLLSFLRAREDVHLLSTWEGEAGELAEAFGFQAKVLLIRDYGDEGGIYGKFTAVRELKPRLWADDQLTPLMENWCRHYSVIPLAPKKGAIAREELAFARAALERVA